VYFRVFVNGVARQVGSQSGLRVTIETCAALGNS
jgi:hypothetical protein